MSDALVVELEHQQSYRHSLGENSPFYEALAQGSLLGTRCDSCGSTFLAPRTNCVLDGCSASWVAISDVGTIVSQSEISQRPSFAAMGGPSLILGLVQIDGVDTAVLAELLDSSECAASDLHPGDRVQAFYRTATTHPAQMLSFVALATESGSDAT